MLKLLGKDATNIGLIEEKHYLLYNDKNKVKFRIGLTKNKKYLVIQALYVDNIENSSLEFFQTKLTLKNLNEKSQKFNVNYSMDECYQIIINSFEEDKVEVKDIGKMKYLKITFNFEIKALNINLLYKNIDTSLINQHFEDINEKEEKNNNDDNQKDNPNLNEKEITSNNNEERKLEEADETKNNYNKNNNEEEKNNYYKKELEVIPLEEVEQVNNIIDNNKKEEYQEKFWEKEITKKEEVFNGEKSNGKESDIENETNNEIKNNKSNNEIIKEEEKIKEINNENIINEEGNNYDNNLEIKEENNINNNIDINEKDKEIINNEENKEEYEDNEKIFECIEKENNKSYDNNNDDLYEIIDEEKVQYNDINMANSDNNYKEEEKLKEDKIKELLKKILLLEKENTFLKEENIKIKNEKISLEKENNSYNKEKNSLRKEIGLIKEENESLKKENNSLKKENDSLKSENDSFKNKLSRANLTEEKLKKSNKEKNDLKIELQKLKNEKYKKKSPEKVINNKKNGFFDIKKNNVIKRQQTSEIIATINSLNIMNDEIKIKKEDDDRNEKNEIIDLKTNKNDIEKNLNFISKPPINLKISKTLTQSSYVAFSLDNAFDAFTSLSGEILLVYATKFKSIECFDIVKQKFKKTILNAHNSMILIIRYYCPIYLNKELILSTSNNPDYCIKIWDIQNWTCIFNLNKIYEKGNMLSVCLHFDEYQKESYIFTSNDTGCIKIWGMDGQFIKNIYRTENNETYFLDIYYDETELKYFLISGEMKCVKSFELNTHQLFRTYIDTNSFAEHVSAFVYKNMGNVELVECEFYGYIRIWNFHSGNLIKKIEICKRIPLVSMCLWNKNYLLVSCVDYTIKLIDFKNYAFIKSFNGHNNEVCTIKKIIHPTYGECLISQGIANEQIKLWINDD